MSFTSQGIDDQAAEWATRMDLRELTPGEQAEFDAWLAADPRHLGAYGRAEAVLLRLERVPGVAVNELRPQAEAQGLTRRRIVLTGSIAASIAAAAVIGAAIEYGNKDGIAATTTTIETGVGQTREAVLPDGSIITLNTDSRISVELTKTVRRIRLLRGEALFDVAKNKNRPFIVFADDTQVRAVGTSFTVSMLPRRPIQVLVREGVVELKRTDATPVWVGASTRALAPRDAPIVAESVSSATLARDLAWQYGQIALENQTLQAAADEFARYSEVHILVDPAVANRTVTGLFSANDPVAFARAAAGVLKLQVQVADNEVRISGSPDVKTVGK